jgi:hypothetical protein
MLHPALSEMRDEASRFSARYPIVDEPGDSFKASAEAWHEGIDALQKSFRADAEALWGSGQLTSAASVAAAVSFLVALLYLLMFLPEAAVFLTDEAGAALRVPLNSANYIRALLALVALHQVWLLWAILGTAFEIAAAMESNVKELKKRTPALAGRGMHTNAHIHDTRRWGVKLLGYTIDSKFWQDFRINLAVGIAVSWVVAWWCWGRIQAKRESLGMRETSLLKKMLGEAKKKNTKAERQQQHLQAEVNGLLVQTVTQQQVIEAQKGFIPFEDLEFARRPSLGAGSYGEVFKGTWKTGGSSIRCVRVIVPLEHGQLRTI